MEPAEGRPFELNERINSQMLGSERRQEDKYYLVEKFGPSIISQ